MRCGSLLDCFRDHGDENANCRLPIAGHGCFSSGGVVSIRSRSQADSRRNAEASQHVVRPRAGSAAVAVSEWMDAHPFCMHPSSQVDGCVDAVVVKVFACGISLLQIGDVLSELGFELP